LGDKDPDSLMELLAPTGDAYIIDSSNQANHIKNLSLLPATHVLAITDLSYQGFKGAKKIIDYVAEINRKKLSKNKIKCLLVLNMFDIRKERGQLRIEDALVDFPKVKRFLIRNEEDLAKAGDAFTPVCQWTKGKRKYFDVFEQIIEEVYA